MVKVRPEARTPKSNGAKASEFGRCSRTTGEMIGSWPPEERVGAGAGCKPRACSPAAMRNESIRTLSQLTWAAVKYWSRCWKDGWSFTYLREDLRAEACEELCWE
jgi:hypothetical protein